MNARQKAKKYKQELEMLKRQTAKPLYIEREPRRVDSFVVKELFSYYPSINLTYDDMKHFLLDKLVHDQNFLNSITVERDFDAERFLQKDQFACYIRLDILRREKE